MPTKGLVSTTVSLANPAFRAVDSKIQAVLVGQAGNDQGQTVRSRMRTPEGYSLTAATAFDAACRLIAGEIKPGFQTSSRAFGAGYILNFDASCARTSTAEGAAPTARQPRREYVSACSYLHHWCQHSTT